MNVTLPAETEVALDPAVLMARQSLYRFAALSLLDPRRGAWSELDALRDDRVLHEAAALLRDLPEARPREYAPGELPPDQLDPAAVLRRLPASPAELNAQYERVFGLVASGGCPPYETEYVDNKLDFQRSNGLADVAGFYRAFGLSISEQHPERPDHVVLELEFMALLAGLERRAAANDDLRTERQTICRDAQERFLREHLAWWAPAFAKLLVREAGEGFYAAAGELLAALIPVERALLGIEPTRRPAPPAPPSDASICDGCQLQQ